jgi:hypothetical protein
VELIDSKNMSREYPNASKPMVAAAANPPLTAGQNPFAESQNPYAAPREEGYLPAQAAWDNPFAGLWAEGDLLVMHKLAPLPEICLKSNQPAKQRLKRNLSWHHPGYFLFILLHILIYVIVALIVRKSATIYIPLSEEWFARRRRRMQIAWGLILLSVVMFCVAIPYVDQQSWAPFLMIGAFPLALGAAIWGLLMCRMVWPKRMTDQYIWLKGVHPDFLRRLEAWQWRI